MRIFDENPVQSFVERLPVVAAAACVAGAAGGQEIARECQGRVDGNAVVHSQTDFGEGLVGWIWTWTAEGVADDVIVADCASGRRLTARARSERMQERLPYDRRRAAMRETLRLTDPAVRTFFTMDRLAAALDDVGVPSRQSDETDETCACAAFYGALRGDKTPYVAQE